MRPHYKEIIKWAENEDSKVYYRKSPVHAWIFDRYPFFVPTYEYKVEINEPTTFGVYDFENSETVKGAYITELDCDEEDLSTVVDMLFNSSAIFERFQADPRWCVKYKGNWQDIPNNDPNYILKSGWLDE